MRNLISNYFYEVLKMGEYEFSSEYMDTKRLETLVDGIFAIAMTLLVLGLAVPQINGPLSNLAVQNAIFNLLPNFISLVVSFILLSVFWKIHHRIFKQITRMDGTLLWINVIWLLFIILVPFSTTLTGEYGQFPISNVIFNLNILGIAFFLYLNWHYATRSNFIHEKVDADQITFTKKINLSFIIIAILALFLSFIIPEWSSIVYLFIIPSEIILKGL
jgi:uncharacterized membrane protein